VIVSAQTHAQRRGDALVAYRRSLAHNLGVGDAAGNLTIEADRLLACEALPPESLLLALAPKYVVTVQEALGSGSGRYLNKQALSLPRTLPRHFVLAMWVLHQKHVASVRSVWKDWLRAMRWVESATIFWSDDELEELEEERLIAKTRARRDLLRREYETMVEVLLEGDLGDDVPDGAITEYEYMWAVTVVSSSALHFADDFPVLTPLLPRFHPHAVSEVYEWGDETDPGAAIYIASSAVSVGQEITIGASQWNDDLLLRAGYLWDDLEVAHIWIRFSGGDRPDGGSEGEVTRRKLQAEANWSSPMDFALTASHLPSQMLPWLRLALAPPETLMHASLRTFDEPQAVQAEGVVVRTLFNTLDRYLNGFEHSIEEDEAILTSPRRQQSVPERLRLAVTYRKLCKQVLLAAQKHVNAHWERVRVGQASTSGERSWKSKRRRKKSAAKHVQTSILS